jgi:cytochrome subunit of sulfide dehydrogenase
MTWQVAPAGTFKRGRRRTLCDRGKSIERVLANGTRLIATLLLAIVPIALIIFRSPAADNNRGAQLAAMCAACHRLDGLDKGIPSIIGLDEKKLADMMAEFKSNKRTSQIMNVVARSLSDEEIADLAHYLATRKKGSGQP